MRHVEPRAAENAILFAAAASRQFGQSVSTNSADRLDWGYILRAAGRQGITPLLAEWVRHAAFPVPSEAGAQLHAAYWANHFRNRILLEQMRNVLAAAQSAAIPVMPLKGAALATWYYPAAALRPMSDLDFLVRPADVRAFSRVLRERGFAMVPKPASVLDERREEDVFREHGCVMTTAGMSILIEYRAEPLDPAVGPLLLANAAMEARYAEHSARIWRRGEQAALDGIPCARIAPEDLLLHVASHLTTRHAGLRLIWLRDLHQIVMEHGGALDWGYIRDVARELHLATPVAAALAASARWLDTPIAPAQMDRLRQAVERRAFWQSVEWRAFGAQIAGLADADLAVADTPIPWRSLAVSAGWFLAGRAPWRVVGRIVVPSRAYMAWWSTRPITSRWAYVRAVLFRIVYIGVTVVAALAARLKLSVVARLVGSWARRIEMQTAYATSGEPDVRWPR